jgi:hypothetical protein
MLRITCDQESSPPRLKLHGKISGPWVEELVRVWSEMNIKGSPALVDLTDVTFVDPEGRRLLAGMLREGAELHAGPLMQFTIERIRQESQDSSENKKRRD